MHSMTYVNGKIVKTDSKTRAGAWPVALATVEGHSTRARYQGCSSFSIQWEKACTDVDRR
jgi:hypothetical protein